MINQGWPQPTKAFDAGKNHRIYDYMRSVKSNVRIGMEKAKHGGKKGKAAKGKPAAEEKGIESLAIYVALDYPDW